MTKNILVTGVNGFVGHHLIHELASHDAAIIGVGRDESAAEDIAPLLAHYICADLTKVKDANAIDLSSIDAVIHLAGLANVGQSFTEPALFLSANAAMSINILQHALDVKAASRFVIISSGAVYDNKQPLPITEAGQLTHGSPYAVSKLAVEMMNDYYRSRGMNVVTMRPFNHIGPGQGPGLLLPDLLAKLRSYQDNHEPIIVGNLDTARDYTDVRDVARAYALVAMSDKDPSYDIYNVCSGTSRTGRDLLCLLSEALGFSELPPLSIDQSLLRPNDALDIYGDNSRISKEFGWSPTIDLTNTIRDVVAD